MILVLNSGSSSIKFKLFATSAATPTVVAEGLAERIGVDGLLTIKAGEKHTIKGAFPNHEAALKLLLDQLLALNILENFETIQGIGFRVVHGGQLSQAALIDAAVLAEIKKSVPLAPLHNPGALVAIEAMKKLLPDCPQVACFDTAFHQTMPEVNYLYPVPETWWTQHAVRKYGFHGISYQYITQKMAAILQKPVIELNLVICHLGNGASICAVEKGRSIETSMGLTPLAGLMMGTRSGDIDPSILEYMTKVLKTDVDTITKLLNEASGLKGLCGFSDMRDVTLGYEQQDPKAILALEKYTQTVADFLVQYVNRLGGKVDAIVFTAGIGENSVIVKKLALQKATLLETLVDDALNINTYEDYQLLTQKSRYPVYAVRTDEETMICHETQKLIS